MAAAFPVVLANQNITRLILYIRLAKQQTVIPYTNVLSEIKQPLYNTDAIVKARRYTKYNPLQSASLYHQEAVKIISFQSRYIILFCLPTAIIIS